MKDLSFNAISEMIFKYLEDDIPAIGRFVFKMALALLVYFILSKIIKWICNTIEKNLIKSAIPKETRTFLTSFSKVALHVVVIMMIAGQLGAKESSVMAILASAGIGIGLALQGGLSNLAAGVVIILAKPFVAGDYITESANNYEGTVKKIELYYTTLATFDNQMVVIPNSVLAGNTIVNVTAMEHRRLEIIFGIYYESNLQVAKDILFSILRNDEDIIQDKEINVFVEELGAQSVQIGLWAWVKNSDYFDVRWKINEKIKEAFDQGHIAICHTRLVSNGKMEDKKQP
jgi:Small-conductance mechanosensitive channel